MYHKLVKKADLSNCTYKHTFRTIPMASPFNCVISPSL